MLVTIVHRSFFNISVQAPFESLNRILFSLFICGCLNDSNSGLVFCLPHTHTWKFIIEVPYSDHCEVSLMENYKKILPILSIICPSTLEEVTDENYKLSINAEEELVARFLKAFEDKTINRIAEITTTGQDIPISFEPITDTDECHECKVAFVAVANKAFDAANANRMICIYRSLPSEDDQKILAYGCLGLQLERQQSIPDDRLDRVIYGLCQGYRRVLRSPDIPHIFHDRDFIYMLRELRFELMNFNEVEETIIKEITPRSLLRALEDNFNGVRPEEFDKLVDQFATAVGEQCPEFQSLLTEKQQFQRNIPTILRNSMKLAPVRRRLYGRYKLIIDESEDESAVRLLFQAGILNSDPSQTAIFRMSDFPDDIDNELRNVEILSNIKLCMETGKTILMINTGRIHDSLYDVFNQNFSIMSTEDSRKIFSKVAIGPKTIDVVVHEDFQCIVHIKRSEFKDIPAPFLSRFQKYSFSVSNFYSLQLRDIPSEEQKTNEGASPESMIFKLPTFEESTTRLLCQHYFYQQEHFNVENFIHQFIYTPMLTISNDELLTMNNNLEQKPSNINITKKLMIFTRTSSSVINVQDDLGFDNFDPQAPVPPPLTTTMLNKSYGNKNESDSTREQFCNQLIQSITNDKILSKIISLSILQSYTNDLVRILSTVIEKNFHDRQTQHQKTIDFVCRWLLLVDEDEKESLSSSFNHHIWQLAHVYTSIEYDENDLLSLYSACRIAEDLDPNQSFYQDLLAEENISRSKVRENLFQLMFHRLWTNLCHLIETNEDAKKWIQSYTLISKYYPSDKVLKRLEFVQMKVNIEFMSFVYLILLNEKTPQPIKLIQKLLNDTSLIQDGGDGRHRNLEESSCLKLLPTIIQTIDQYFKENNANNGTLMMDIQQWILATLKVSKGSSYQEIISLLKFLNQPTCHLSLPMKQLIFDELIKILIEISQQKRLNVPQQQFIDAWDRISFLSVMTECIDDETLENYQIPYHTSVINNTNQNHMLMDLLFFHLRRLINNERIRPSFINKILLSNLPRINDANRVAIADKVFKQLKDYFILLTTGLLLCQPDLDNEDQQKINQIIGTVIDQYLIIPKPFVQLSKNLELFFSVIVAKKSWVFLLDLLKSKRIQDANIEWADALHDLFTGKCITQSRKHLHLCHQVQFTLTTDNTESIFPALHVPYDELSQLISECIKNNDAAKRWIPLTDWITSKLNSNPPLVSATEIKVMLLLNIYYVYYCNAQLNSLDNILKIIEDKLQLCDEEQRVFRALLQPEQHMIGYPNENNVKDNNYLNDLFKIDFKDDEQLPIRHTLVNLLAMILLGGKENTLWMFAFEPLKLEENYGFASTATSPIKRSGVHYDCGCVLSEKGELEQLYGGSEFSIPAVYIAFFATFGAMAWHLLLYESSVDNLHHPILAKHAINPTADLAGISKDSIRARTCYFVCTRLLSTNMFLQLQLNQDDACLLFNRCFELFAQHTRQLDQNPWIKPLYKTNADKLEAEKEFRNKIFYPTHKRLVDYKQIINKLESQSEPQTRLLDYVSRMSIIIEVIHFKTELCNPESSQLPLTVLRRLLDSFEFLKMTRYIYALSQFHVLIHRTFTRLIEQNEFHTITLKELYERASQLSNRLRQSNQQDKYYKIIEKGIEAVNAYHSFANGQIRPGACDITQRFEPISMDTPISYLVETDSYDEGDIIMRILR
ncbi:unnamed protein product [Rotaria sp. Silwood1]|nr:unnamed protein product [Rotaria sp. Silwood1]